MSNNRLELQGLAELRAALRNLPKELTGEASHIVEGAANGAAATVKGNYKRGKTGNLIAGVVVEQTSGGQLSNRFSAGAVVKSKAKHAWLYENGSQVRHTAKGAHRGVMPAAPPGRAFIPVMIKARRQMYGKLADVLKRHGLQVSGTP